jgi:dienelactone hydrolase
MVLLYGCGGPERHIYRWAEWFRDKRFAALVVDSFAPRHTATTCTTGTSPSIAEFAGDAFGARAYLESLPLVDGGRIGVIGWSYGGTAALQANSKAFADNIRPPGRGFRAAVAYYPICSSLFADTNAPLLLLLGAADDWAPPQACLDLGARVQREGRVVEWHLYPGARHAFDDADLGAGAVIASGHTLQYDRTAAADAETRVLLFLTKYLSR